MTVVDTAAAMPRSHGYLGAVARRFMRHRLGMASLCFLTGIVLLALLAPFLTPYEPNKLVGKFSAPPDALHLLGTDQVGRDVLTRLLYATRVSLLVGVMATAIATAVGVVLGLVSGYFGGAADMVIMRFTDMVMSFPYILLVLVAAAVFTPGLWNMILILGFVDWPGVARLVRGNVLSLRETAFVQADIVAGMPTRHTLFFRDTAQHHRAHPCVCDFGGGDLHFGRGGAELFGHGRAAADGEPWQHAQRRAVHHRAHQQAVAVGPAGRDDHFAGAEREFCGRRPA